MITITGSITTALIDAIMLTQLALPLPNFHISEEYPEQFQNIQNEAFYSVYYETAYGTPTTTKWQWLDEIMENAFGFDPNFPECTAYVSDYCVDDPPECNSEWGQYYFVSGLEFKMRSYTDDCIKDKYEYIKSKVGKEFNTYSEYGYGVSRNKIYINLDERNNNQM